VADPERVLRAREYGPEPYELRAQRQRCERDGGEQAEAAAQGPFIRHRSS
jgi:hypothetical protein